LSLHVLDTDTLTLLSHGHAAVTAAALRLPPDELAVTIVTVEETFIGRYSQIRRARSRSTSVAAYGHLLDAIELFRSVTVLGYDEPAARLFEDLRRQFPRRGTNDLRIAAIVLAAHATLVSANLSDFQQIAGLRIIDWSA
jgi:tRNA(fMet)-specific endonuclease VapC